MRHLTIPSQINKIRKETLNNERIASIKSLYKGLRKDSFCNVSIVVPVYNEEKNILTTLHSLVLNKTNKAVEIIVVNNNSSDNTEALVKASGVTCILEKKQGITAARNAGLQVANGQYILNADADTIYPSNWINTMVSPLEKNRNVALTYGSFSFIPTAGTPRFIYFFYECITGLIKFINRYFKEEAVNVYGFNSCYRRTQGLEVGGYDHPIGSNEDGWLALKLRNEGFGKLNYIANNNALVWTTDRRLQLEGGFLKGVKKRVRKILFPHNFTELRTDL